MKNFYKLMVLILKFIQLNLNILILKLENNQLQIELFKEVQRGKKLNKYIINLILQEKEFAFKIVKRFKQNICGFDIFKYNGKNYVYDVNGWCFFKEIKNIIKFVFFIFRK